mgnify:CR=1 FL=1
MSSHSIYMILRAFEPAPLCIGKPGAAVKIGIAKDPRARLSNIQTACPDEVTLLAHQSYRKRSDAERAERRLHEHYGHFHLRGEWFQYTEELAGLATLIKGDKLDLRDLPKLPAPTFGERWRVAHVAHRHVTDEAYFAMRKLLTGLDGPNYGKRGAALRRGLDAMLDVLECLPGLGRGQWEQMLADADAAPVIQAHVRERAGLREEAFEKFRRMTEGRDEPEGT